MKHSHKYCGITLALALLLSGCAGRGAGTLTRAGEPPKADAPGRGPHTAASVMDLRNPVARSGWLELFLDDASKTVSIRSHSEAEWSTLPRLGGTPQSNAGACAVEADIYVNGHKLTLNSQDHSVAYGNAAAKNVKDAHGEGVQVDYILTPDAAAAEKARSDTLTKDDTAFVVRVRYMLVEGNLHVQAGWENLSRNPDAFIASLGLMERFGALRSPGPNDFFLLPDGCGALLYPGRDYNAAAQDLRFAVYGSDPSVPGHTDALRANVAAWGVRGQGAGFAAVAERGAALCEITARQAIPGEIPQSAVGPRFTVTPVALRENGTVSYRAASYGEAEDEPFSVTYRFFNGDTANFNTMATACREQLISIGVLSSTKSVKDDGMVPLGLTLLGTGPAKLGQKNLTSFEQAQDILMRLKNKGVNSLNVRYRSALSGGWLQKAAERVSPLLRLGGAGKLRDLQDYCKSKGLSLFLDVQAFPAGGLFVPKAKNLAGQDLKISSGKRTVTLRASASFTRMTRAVLTRLGKLNTAGISVGDAGSTLYADYSGAGTGRMQAAERLDALLPALSARWLVMLDTGDFHAARHADVIDNLPLEPQLPVNGRYLAAPLLPMLLHGNADYAGAPLVYNAAESGNSPGLLRAIAYGACPAFTWDADEGDEALFFEPQLDYALKTYERANAALKGLRAVRITEYEMDPVKNVSRTRYSNEAVVYVNFSDKEKPMDEIVIPPNGYVRIG